jgi:hypothetical protein
MEREVVAPVSPLIPSWFNLKLAVFITRVRSNESANRFGCRLGGGGSILGSRSTIQAVTSVHPRQRKDAWPRRA